jgi:hypothetical protein
MRRCIAEERRPTRLMRSTPGPQERERSAQEPCDCFVYFISGAMVRALPSGTGPDRASDSFWAQAKPELVTAPGREWSAWAQ